LNGGTILELDEAVEKRRAYRAFKEGEITDEMVEDLLRVASLAPSCNNNQPWRFVMVRDPMQLRRLFETLTRGNYWMQKASMIAAAITESGSDCDVQGVQYEMFDTGMAAAFMMLKAVDLGLINHPIAGFNKVRAKEVLGLSEDHVIITLIGIGKKNEDISSLGEKHQIKERSQRERKPISEIGFNDKFR
jgi:nitroreductase